MNNQKNNQINQNKNKDPSIAFQPAASNAVIISAPAERPAFQKWKNHPGGYNDIFIKNIQGNVYNAADLQS